MEQRVALATYKALASLSRDDQLVLPELALRRVVGVPAVWDDPDVRWASFDAVVIRSCWDYHTRPDAFREWIDRVRDAGVSIWNPPAVLHWNIEKTYLRELVARGLSVVPTRWIERGSGARLATVLEEEGWIEAVVKPVVSASAENTWRTSSERASADEARFSNLVAREGVMVQRFVQPVQTEGEWSLCFFGGEFSHAVLKRPVPGDFRVQSEFGGTRSKVTPDPALIAEASAVLAAAPERCLYARVDGCVVEGAFWLMELELLEPSLFLAYDRLAPARFAEAIRWATAISPRTRARPDGSGG
jgi:hypothetical protein